MWTAWIASCLAEQVAALTDEGWLRWPWRELKVMLWFPSLL